MTPTRATLRTALRQLQNHLRTCNRTDLLDLYEKDSVLGTDVYLQCLPDAWKLWVGKPRDDTRGVWAASFLPYERSNLSYVAADLIDQVRNEI